MKNIKYSLIICLQIVVFQLVAQDQTNLNNGREQGVLPGTPTIVEENKQGIVESFNEIDDADIPGTYYLRGGSDNTVIYGDEGPTNLLERLDALESELQQLRLSNEQLAQENRRF